MVYRVYVEKKGELSEYEKELLQNNRTVWGCDICQLICPLTKKAIEKAGYSTEQIKIALDIASSEWWIGNGKYKLPTRRTI